MITAIVMSLLLLLLVPQTALAWGMGVHLEIGAHLLAHPGVFSAEVQLLLATYPYDFLYGCISADITIGKRFTPHLTRCHSWRMMRKLLDAADSDAMRACAHGYFSHLGADTVAHGYFVPYKMIRTFPTQLLQHAYWEMRMEALVAPHVRDLSREISRRNFPEHDAMLRNTMARSFFSFDTNRRLFNSMLLLGRFRHWQRGLQVIAERSRWQIDEEDHAEYLVLARDAATSILADGKKSPYRNADPTGARAMRTAKHLRRRLRHLRAKGELPPERETELLLTIRSTLREAITEPERLTVLDRI